MNKKFYILAIASILLYGCQKDAAEEALVQEQETTASETAAPLFGEMTDERDGTVYKTLQIGEQVWFAENLRTTQYKDGTDIPYGHGVDTFSLEPEERIFYFNPNADVDGDANVETYGRLYTYGAAIKGICPVGWRVSTDVDWVIMEMELGMSVEEVLGHHFEHRRGQELAPKLMATADIWPDSVGTNESGFNALPAGYKSMAERGHPSYDYFGGRAYFLTTSRGPEGVYYNATRTLDQAIRRNMEGDSPSINRDSNIRDGYGYSVRCVEGDYFPIEKQQPPPEEE